MSLSVTNNYVGIPFIDGGRSLKGADCWGIIKLMYADLFDFELPDYQISAFQTEKVIVTMEKEASRKWVQVKEPIFGDVVAMANHPRHRDRVNHVGFYLQKGRFLHAMKETGSIISRVAEIGSPKIIGIYRWAR